MLKCVKIVLDDVNDVGALYTAIKKRASIDELEGVAQPVKGRVEIVVRGPKGLVDEFVGAVDETVIKYGIKEKHHIGFAVEPFLEPEDYRGIFRFIQTDLSKKK